ncbi:lanthionine synthetase LanC family protein [Pseudofrankia sp. BMG5.36]|uniref:lanthionine synthetase LanC family protein n=1 Tax=Pseudofrankia sp. BMG5.36 TaxID=1834512 RepID=UPI0008DAE37D|nr:lanthionine synthetase LanC family protein [Pseudofrankia sp. BMG5.36]OHV61331.1 hypothetical protein BCD48_39935 [Pseudofrankia sp. BMG5.36]
MSPRTATADSRTAGLAGAIADRLTNPAEIAPSLTATNWWRQSLAHGAPGVALLHIERAALGLARWRPAHDWITYLAAPALTTGPDSHLFYGAPALAHVLACANAHQPQSYRHALDGLDHDIARQTRSRVDAAHARLDRSDLPALAEFDLIRGLTGLGSYLLHRDPAGTATHAVLEYLVRLSEPISHDGEAVPGWWTLTGPAGRPSDRFDGGHANHFSGVSKEDIPRICGVFVRGRVAGVGRCCYLMVGIPRSVWVPGELRIVLSRLVSFSLALVRL